MSPGILFPMTPAIAILCLRYAVWEEKYETDVKKILAETLPETRSDYGSNLSSIKTALHNDTSGRLKVPGDFPRSRTSSRSSFRPDPENVAQPKASEVAKSGATQLPHIVRQRAQEEETYRGSGLVVLKQEIEALKSTVQQRDAEIAELVATRAQLQYANARLQSELGVARDVATALDLRGLAELKAEIYFHRQEREWLYTVLTELAVSDDIPDHRCEHLKTRILSENQVWRGAQEGGWGGWRCVPRHPTYARPQAVLPNAVSSGQWNTHGIQEFQTKAQHNTHHTHV